MSGNKQLIVQIQLFQTKMLCSPLQNTSVAHRLKTTALDIQQIQKDSSEKSFWKP